MIKSENMTKVPRREEGYNMITCMNENLNIKKTNTCKSLCLGVGEGELEAQRLSSSSDESKELLLPALIIMDT